MVEKYVKDRGPSPVKWIFLAVFAALFVADIWFVASGRSGGPDDGLLAVFVNMRDDALTVFFRAVTFCGDQATVIALCILIIALPGRMKVGLPVALMTAAGALVQSVLKEMFARPRPDAEYWLVGDTDWLGFSLGYSFPSGHANTSMIFWVALMILTGRILIMQENRLAAVLLRVVFFLFALLVGISRLYLGVHYLSDVFAGWMLAGLLLIIFFSLYDNFWPSKWRVTYDKRAWDAMPRGSEKKRRWRKPVKKRAPSELLKFPKKRAPWKLK